MATWSTRGQRRSQPWISQPTMAERSVAVPGAIEGSHASATPPREAASLSGRGFRSNGALAPTAGDDPCAGAENAEGQERERERERYLRRHGGRPGGSKRDTLE